MKRQPPTIVGGRTLVPVRAVLEAMGCTLEWDSEKREITVYTDGSKIIKMQMGSNNYVDEHKFGGHA